VLMMTKMNLHLKLLLLENQIKKNSEDLHTSESRLNEDDKE